MWVERSEWQAKKQRERERQRESPSSCRKDERCLKGANTCSFVAQQVSESLSFLSRCRVGGGAKGWGFKIEKEKWAETETGLFILTCCAAVFTLRSPSLPIHPPRRALLSPWLIDIHSEKHQLHTHRHTQKGKKIINIMHKRWTQFIVFCSRLGGGAKGRRRWGREGEAVDFCSRGTRARQQRWGLQQATQPEVGTGEFQVWEALLAVVGWMQWLREGQG